MRKLYFTFAALIVAAVAQANIVLDETFAYENGTQLTAQQSWIESGTLTSGDGRTISATPLVYATENGEYALSEEGKAVKQSYAAGSNYIAYRTFDKISSGVVYLSYLYQPDGKQSQSNGEILGLTSVSEESASPTARPWVGKIDDTTKGDPYHIGLTFRSGTGADIQWSTKELSITDVVFIVLKYDLDNNTASLFINPEIGSTTEPVADVTDNNNGTAETYRSSINAIMFRNQGSSKSNCYMSGVRVSTTWAEAVEKKETETTPIETIDFIDTDFTDGTWGDLHEGAYTSGEYPTTTINGFDFAAAGMQDGSIKYAVSEGDTIQYNNRISIDKSGNGGMVTLPAVATCKEVVIYTSAGSEDRDLKLQNYNFATKAWSDLETYHYAVKATCYRWAVELNTNEPCKLRLVNADGSTKYIWKITTIPTEGGNEDTGLNNMATKSSAQKLLINGSIYIIRNGEMYNINGLKIK